MSKAVGGMQQLSNAGIHEAIERIRGFMEGCRVSSEDLTRACLTMEEALLRYQEHFGEAAEFRLEMHRVLGQPRVTLRLRGESYDPFVYQEGDLLSSAMLTSLLDYEALHKTYVYRSGENRITLYAARQLRFVKIPGGAVTVAILLAILAGLVLRLFVPVGLRDLLITDVATPILNTILGIIVGVTGPMIFFSVVSGVCALEDIATLTDMGLKVIGRFFLLLLFSALITVVLCLGFFGGVSLHGEGALSVGELLKLLLEIVPTNILTPFTEGKTIQIVILAGFLGVCLLMLSERVSLLRSVIGEGNTLIFRMMNIVSKLIPYAVFLSMARTITTSSLGEILSVWRIVAVCMLTYVINCACLLLRMVVIDHQNPLTFLKAVSPVLLVAVSTASGSACMSTNYDVAKQGLGVDDKPCNFWIPLSHTMFSPGTIPKLVVCAFFGAAYAGTSLSVSQLLITLLLGLQLSIASPKIPGGDMASFTLLLTQLGMPLEVVGLMMVPCAFLDNIAAAVGMLIRDCELADFAYRLKKMRAA
ncbi:MAG: dicarboxylate/amino acid:cation symporter [Butyrivibrio sp.]|nr:dicarboxylate/amino acid:cation symporter [Butyrivibrio sp.]